MPSAEKDPLATENEKQQKLPQRSEAISNLLIPDTWAEHVPFLSNECDLHEAIFARGVIDIPGGRLLCIMVGK